MQLGEDLPSLVFVFVADVSDGQKNSREGREVAAMFGGHSDVGKTIFFIALNAPEMEKPTKGGKKTPDDVLGKAAGEVGVIRMRIDRQ